jgi:hypothetical protein
VRVPTPGKQSPDDEVPVWVHLDVVSPAKARELLFRFRFVAKMFDEPPLANISTT